MRTSQYHDPAVLAEALQALAPGYKRVVGIDLGTHTGVAWADILPGAPLSSAKLFAGQLDLSLAPYDTGPTRFLRLKQFLCVLSPQLVGFEDVKYTPAAMEGATAGVIVARVSQAAELLGGLKVMLVTWAEERRIPVQSFGIGQIKRYATGKGNANKVAMIEAANTKYGANLNTDDYEATGEDNIADALHICAMVIETYTNGL